MDREQYLDKYAKCRRHLERIMEHKVVEVGPFIAALKYVLEVKTGRCCIIYNARYGELDFAVNAIRFKLLWQPETTDLTLICRHMEGEKFIDAGINITAPDLMVELVDTIEFSVNHVTPFDV